MISSGLLRYMPLLIIISIRMLFAIEFNHTAMIIPGGDWVDTQGKRIVATEGGIIKAGEKFYLWGMDRSANNYTFVAVNLYESTDFKNWTFLNQILKSTSHPDLDKGAVVERAKILRHPKTGKCVMWMHYEGLNPYKTAEVAYAVCDSISGNYTLISHFRPLDIDSRDINVYQDEDGKGYLICTTKGNQSVSLFELDDSYTRVVREVYRGLASNDMECEGHAIIKTGGYYFWLMSWCTGWDFNDNHYFYSRSLTGPWISGGTIAVANTHTYESQVGFAVTVPGSVKKTFLYTGDRWSVNNYSMSRIVLLPIEVSGTKLKVDWHDQWDIDAQTGEWSSGSKNFIDGVYCITAKHSGLVLGTEASSVRQQKYTGAKNQLWRIQNVGASHLKVTSVASGKVLDVSGASRTEGAKILQYAWNDAYNQKWHIIDCGKGFHRFISVNTLGKAIEIADNSMAASGDAVLGNFRYGDNQLFKITHVHPAVESEKQYMILNRTSGLSLTGADRTAVRQTTPHQKPGQVWQIQDLYNSFFTISSVVTGNALDNGGAVQNGALVVTEISDSRSGQQWQIVPVAESYYKLVNRYSGKCLDSKDGSSTEESFVIQHSDYASNNSNQQWQFVPVRNVPVCPDTQHPACSVQNKRTGFQQNIVYDLRGAKVHRLEGSSAASLPSGVFIIRNNTVTGTTTRYYCIIR